MAHYFGPYIMVERWRTGSAGVAALEALIGAPSAEPEGKGSKFADVLSSALRRCCEGDRPSGALKENDARRNSSRDAPPRARSVS